MPAGSGPAYLYQSVSDPERFSGEMLVAALYQAGTPVDGSVAVAAAGADARELAEVEGQPLGEQLRQMLSFSNNYIADVLALDLLRDDSTNAPLDLKAAGDRLAAFAAEVNAESPFSGASPRVSPTLHSGSGLTVGNRLSARELIALLDHVYRRYGDFPAFLRAMSDLDRPRSRPWASGGEAWLTRIAAKTCSLDDPLTVFALAGYFRFRDGRWGAFALLINDRPGRRRIDRNQALGAIRQDLQRLLAAE